MLISLERLIDKFLSELEIKSEITRLDQNKVEQLISNFIKFGQQNTLFKKFADISSINNNVCKINTGFNRIQFTEISNNLKTIRESDLRSKNQALAVYLFWLITGLDQRQIAAHFEIKNHFEVFRYRIPLRVKPFVGVTSNGRILDIFGLHPANKSDGDILQKDNTLKEFLQENDILILDRGFTRVESYLKDIYNLTPMIPSSIRKDEKQLSTLEANKSRIVTKCRWVVEVLNSFLKRSFKALDGVTNKELGHTLDDYRIAAALINKFFQRLYSDNDNVQIAIKMKEKLHAPNLLSDFVKENKLHKKTLFLRLETAEINDFLVLTVNEIVNDLTFGNYQVDQAKSYLGQHFSGRGKREFFVYTDKCGFKNGKILFGEIRSRFKNSTKYKTFVNYEPNKNSIHSILSWYCTCICGSRTLGCCSHVASLVLFFSNIKYLNEISWPAESLQDFFDPESDNSDIETQDKIVEPQSSIKYTEPKKLNKLENSPILSSLKRDLSDLKINANDSKKGKISETSKERSFEC
ncbi:unnamed protein product [Brachionus calyciflorus]|uniref:SWIM-type domain-containing protein n=1 Tax=Brachionus calyciflorus TaxID=104777 RepID=A0A813N9S6_9BILA|nr:unnamed protein product [Brachionus calyciflorus]